MVQGEAASEKRFVEEIVRRFEERGVDVDDLLLGVLSKEDRKGAPSRGLLKSSLQRPRST